jgi:hypothetical protein
MPRSAEHSSRRSRTAFKIPTADALLSGRWDGVSLADLFRYLRAPNTTNANMTITGGFERDAQRCVDPAVQGTEEYR